MFEKATEIAARADIFVIIGTSLQATPQQRSSSRRGTPVDPRPGHVPANVTVIRDTATAGMRELERILREKYA